MGGGGLGVAEQPLAGGARTRSVEVRCMCRSGVANDAHGLTRRQFRALHVPLALDNYRFWMVVVDNTKDRPHRR